MSLELFFQIIGLKHKEKDWDFKNFFRRNVFSNNSKELLPG